MHALLIALILGIFGATATPADTCQRNAVFTWAASEPGGTTPEMKIAFSVTGDCDKPFDWDQPVQWDNVKFTIFEDGSFTFDYSYIDNRVFLPFVARPVPSAGGEVLVAAAAEVDPLMHTGFDCGPLYKYENGAHVYCLTTMQPTAESGTITLTQVDPAVAGDNDTWGGCAPFGICNED